MSLRAQATMVAFLLLLPLFLYLAEARIEYSNIMLHKRDGETSAVVEQLCRMTSQQSAIVDNTLYLMGGNVVYGLDDVSNNYILQIAAPNTYLRTIDLTQSFNLSEGAMHTRRYDMPVGVPEISEGCMWADHGRLILVGGITEGVNKTYPNYTAPSTTYDVWSYDAGSGGDRVWKALSMRGDKVMRAFSAAGTYVLHLRKGYLLGGMVTHDSQATVPSYVGQVDISGLLVWDGAGETWTNLSTPWLRRHSAGSFYLPYGEQGVLAVFGGLTEERQTLEYNSNTFPMTRIDIYDIAKNKWYSQTTSGDAPSHRAKFCGQVVSAPDNSSHQIYIFGGARGTPGIGQNYNALLTSDIYVLTVPTFEWQLVWDGSLSVRSDVRAPLAREHATCNLVSGHAMMIYGGKISADVAPTTCDGGGVYLFDLNDWSWRQEYSSATQDYAVPQEIWSVIGGNETGGAIKFQPKLGFDDSALATLMSNSTTLETKDIPTSTLATKSTSISSSPISQSSKANPPSSGTIAGGVTIGVFAVVALIGGLIWYCRRRPPKVPDSRKDGPVELHGNPAIYEKPHRDNEPIELPTTMFSTPTI